MARARSSAPSTTTSIGSSGRGRGRRPGDELQEVEDERRLDLAIVELRRHARRREQQRRDRQRQADLSDQAAAEGRGSVTHDRAHSAPVARGGRADRNRRSAGRQESSAGPIHAGAGAADSFPEVPGAADAPDQCSALPQPSIRRKLTFTIAITSALALALGGSRAGRLRHRHLPAGADPRHRSARRPRRQQQHGVARLRRQRRRRRRRCSRCPSARTSRRPRSTRRRASAWPPTPAPASRRRCCSRTPTASPRAGASSRSCDRWR